MLKAYCFEDYSERYHSIMVFDKNKNVLVHRWYPFVEGYSKEFIEDILNELPSVPTCALEPFCGSGTTPVELQNYGIPCYSFEVSPFMYLLAKVKLERSYDEATLLRYRGKVAKSLEFPIDNIRSVETLPFGDTVVKRGDKKKYNYHDSSIDGLLDIRYAIRTEIDDDRYVKLFTIALASIVLQTSNMFRNGKCLSYKDGWENRILTREEVHRLFLSKIDTVIVDDVKIISDQRLEVNNSELCFYGDVRKNIDIIPDNSLDLIITSPPYLNSRDYTDIYMLELKVLELVHTHEDLQNLRKATIRSHVQVKYSDIDPIDNLRLKQCLADMKGTKSKSWNPDIVRMICGYFEDMQQLFGSFAKKMRNGGVIYFNVANSAYFGVEVPVDYIIGDIAEDCGFRVREIRKARDLKTSPQQSGRIGKLRESVLIIDKK